MVDDRLDHSGKLTALRYQQVHSDADIPSDINLQWSDYHVLSNPHPELRLQSSKLCATEYAKRNHLNGKQPRGRIWRPLHLPSLGMDRSLLHSRYPRRRSYVICTCE